MQSSYNKYGKENFKWETIEFISTDNKTLEKLEDKWIVFHKSLDRKYGYNQRLANRNLSYIGSGKIVKGEKNFRAVEYYLIDIFTMKEYKGKCIAEFARRMNIKYADSFFRLRSGQIYIWNRRFVTPQSIGNLKFYTFRNTVTEKIIQHFSLIQIYKYLNFKNTELGKVSSGRRKQYNDWIKIPKIENKYIIL